MDRKLWDKLGSIVKFDDHLRNVLRNVKQQIGIDAEFHHMSDSDVVHRIMKDVFQIDCFNVIPHCHDVTTCSYPLCDYPICARRIVSSFDRFFAIPPEPNYTKLDLDNPERPEKKLKDQLLSHSSNTPAAVGVKGMGGAGKTTCLIGVANDRQVQEAFPDGTLWIQLSMHTIARDMRGILMNILKYAWYHWKQPNVQVAFNPQISLDDIVETTREALRERTLLIVLDDFWPFHDYRSCISHFLRLQSPSSTILLSTRYSEVIRRFGADATDVGDLDDDTASALFDDWCEGKPTGKEEENLKKEILHLCSNGALAVCIVGSNVKRSAEFGGKKYGLERVLRRLKRNMGDLQELDHAREDQKLHAVIETTIDSMTDEDHKNGYRCLAVFNNKTRIPNQTLEALWDMDTDDVEDRVDLYLACSLATRKVPVEPGSTSSFHVEFHDQHLAYARYSWCRTSKKLTTGKRSRSWKEEDLLKCLHARLVDGYQELHHDANARVWWEAAPLSDGYFYENYVGHLIKSGRVKDMLDVLMDYRWIALRCKRQEMLGLLGDFGHAIAALKMCLTRRPLEREQGDFDGSCAGSSESIAQVSTGTRYGSAYCALRLVQRALQASQAALWEHSDEISFQLVGRLQTHSSRNKFIKRLIDGARQWEQRPWLCPVAQCFESPMSGASQVLHSDSAVFSVATSPKKLHVVACGTVEGHIRMWDSNTGRLLWSQKAHHGGVSSLEMTKDGRVVVSGAWDKTVQLWDAESGESKGLLGAHEQPVTSIAVTQDGSVVVSGSWDKKVRLWSTENGACNSVLCGHEGPVTSVAVTGDGCFVVSGSDDSTVRLWSMESGECKCVFRGHEGWVRSVAVTEDGGAVVSGSADKTVRLWNTESRECKVVLRGHEDAVTSIALTEDGNVVVSGSGDNTVRLWNLESGECKSLLRGHEYGVTSVAVTEDGSAVVSGSADNTVRLWNAESAALQSALRGHELQVSSVAVTEDGGVVVSGSLDKTVRLWNTGTGECEGVRRGHESRVSSVAVAGDGAFVVSGSNDCTVRLWSVECVGCMRVLRGHKDWVASVAVTKDGSLVVSGSADKKIRLWNPKNGECKRVLRGHEDYVNSVAVTDDGNLVVSGSDDNTVRLWNVNVGECKSVLRGHESWVTSVAVAEDGSVVVSVSDDRTARLWNAESGECLKTATWGVDYPDVFAGRDLLRWTQSIGFLTTYDGIKCSGPGSLSPLPTGISIRVESGVVRVERDEHVETVMSATFDHNVLSAFGVHSRGCRRVIAVGRYMSVLEIMNLAQLDEREAALAGEGDDA